MKLRVLILLGISLGATGAPVSKISVGPRLVCGLGDWDGAGRQSLRCWDLGLGPRPGAPLPPLPVEAPREVAVSGDEVCVREPARIRCWKYAPGGVMPVAHFANLTRPQLLAPGPAGKFCAFDSGSGLWCTHLGTTGGPFRRPRALAVGAGEQICAVETAPYQRRTLPCTRTLTPQFQQCSENLSRVYFETRNAREIAVYRGRHRECRACVVDDYGLRCWNGGEPPREGYHWPSEKVHDVAIVGTAERRLPCVVGRGKVRCQIAEHTLADHPGYASLPDVLAFDGVDDSHCAANAREMLCHTPRGEVRFWHGASLSFELASLESLLRTLAGRVYRAKADYFLAVARALEETIRAGKPSPENEARWRYFVFLSLAPAIENTRSELFEQAVLPAYARTREQYRARFGLARLVDFPREPLLEKGALALLEAHLPALAPSENLARFRAAVGRGDLADLRAAYRALEPELAPQPTGRGVELLMRWLRGTSPY